MAVSKDSANLAVGLADGSIILFDGFMLIERATLERHKEEVTCLAFF
jgi:WD40 repeat protein